MKTSITFQLRHMKFVKTHHNNGPEQTATHEAVPDSSSRFTCRPQGTVPVPGHSGSQLITTQAWHVQNDSPGFFHQNNTSYFQSKVNDEPQQSRKSVSSCSASSPSVAKINTVRCFTCQTDVVFGRMYEHLFFGQLQCAHCSARIINCDKFRRNYNSEKMCTMSKSGKHNFDKWLGNVGEYLAYEIRKDLKIKNYVSHSVHAVAVEDVQNAMQMYMKNLDGLRLLPPWKSVINEYYKRHDAKQENSSTMNQDCESFVGFEDDDICLVAANTSKTISALISVGQVASPSQAIVYDTVTEQNENRDTELKKIANDTVTEQNENRDTELKRTASEMTGNDLMFRKNVAQNSKVTKNGKKQQNKMARVNVSGKHEFIPAGVHASGHYLIVRQPGQSTPHECPDCYCRFDNTMVRVNCSHCIVYIQCPDCMLTIYTIPADTDRRRLRAASCTLTDI